MENKTDGKSIALFAVNWHLVSSEFLNRDNEVGKQFLPTALVSRLVWNSFTA